MDIPIRNIYYLLCYAWDRLDEGSLVDVSGIETNRLPNLFAKVLIGGCNRLFREGIDRGYLDRDEDLRGIKGKLVLGASLKRALLPQGRTLCSFDELDHNILNNQILKATALLLLKASDLDSDLRTQLIWLVHRMQFVDSIRLSRVAFRKVQLHRNNAFYRFLLNVCELIYDSMLVDEVSGDYRFRDFVRERMWDLFQRFVFNFYRLEQLTFEVNADQFEWDAQPVGGTAENILPRMETDITLRAVHAERVIVIDTKFTPETLAVRGGGAPKVKSADLYQLFAYLQNYQGPEATTKPPASMIEGLLLYPTVVKDIDLKFLIHGHPVRIFTLDLAQPWEDIRTDLLSLLH